MNIRPWIRARGEETRELVSFTFTVSLATTIAFYLIEAAFPTFISSHVNMNIVLGVTILTGLGAIALPERESVVKTTHQRLTRSITWSLVLGIIGSVYVFSRVKAVGNISYLIASLSGLIILTLSLVLLIVDETDADSGDPHE